MIKTPFGFNYLPRKLRNARKIERRVRRRVRARQVEREREREKKRGKYQEESKLEVLQGVFSLKDSKIVHLFCRNFKHKDSKIYILK